MPKRTLAVLLSLAALALASSASADDTQNVTTLKTTVVYGTRVRPSVAIEVSRAKAEIKLKDLQDPKVEQIMRAAAKAPF